jgi:hypothetical protein
VHRLSGSVKGDDIRSFLGDEELYTRDTPSNPVNMIHKFGLLEINCITGESEIEAWYDPEKRSIHPTIWMPRFRLGFIRTGYNF